MRSGAGDSGVYSRTGGTTRFHPSFPACLPTVTAVGATLLNDDKTETTATKWSGGMFCSILCTVFWLATH